MNKSLEDTIIKAQTGDKESRQWIIQQYRPFIIRVASHICKQHIEWSDDEASISLIAFNEAIDRFRENSEKTF
ncbi:MAG: RNA polymerase sigma-I factor, partial [Paenibacillaceae bacterium]